MLKYKSKIQNQIMVIRICSLARVSFDILAKNIYTALGEEEKVDRPWPTCLAVIFKP